MSAEPASSVRNSIEDAMPLRSMQTLQRVKALYEAWGRGTYGPVFEALDEGVVWELFAPPELSFAGIRRETAVTIYNEISRGVPAAVLSAITVPTLVVAGEKDSSAITDASLEAVRRGIPGVMTAIAPGMHHQWNIENVELFNSSLRGWLDRREVAEGLGASI